MGTISLRTRQRMRALVLVATAVACTQLACCATLYGLDVADSISFVFSTSGSGNNTARYYRDHVNGRNRQDLMPLRSEGAYTYMTFIIADPDNSSQVIPRHVTIQWTNAAVPPNSFASLDAGKYNASDMTFCNYVEAPPAARSQWLDTDFYWWFGDQSTPLGTHGWNARGSPTSQGDVVCPTNTEQDGAGQCKYLMSTSWNLCSLKHKGQGTKLYFSKSSTGKYLPNTQLHTEWQRGDQGMCDLDKSFSEYYHDVKEEELPASAAEDFFKPLMSGCKKGN